MIKNYQVEKKHLYEGWEKKSGKYVVARDAET